MMPFLAKKISLYTCRWWVFGAAMGGRYHISDPMPILGFMNLSLLRCILLFLVALETERKQLVSKRYHRISENSEWGIFFLHLRGWAAVQVTKVWYITTYIALLELTLDDSICDSCDVVTPFETQTSMAHQYTQFMGFWMCAEKIEM